MGAIQDLLQEVPLSAVLKERVALAEQKYEAAMRENATLKQRIQSLEQETVILRAQVPTQIAKGIDEGTTRVLAYLFRAEGDNQDVGIAANRLQMEKGLVKYHLDQLDEAGLATCTGGNYVSGHVYWSLTPAGRRYAVENKLI
jgi:DNA-binding HxlR family transcriptional regulator